MSNDAISFVNFVPSLAKLLKSVQLYLRCRKKKITLQVIYTFSPFVYFLLM